MSPKISDLIADQPVSQRLKTRIVNALEVCGIRTLEDLEDYVDRHSYRLAGSGRMYRLQRLPYMFQNIGPGGAAVLRRLLPEDKP